MSRLNTVIALIIGCAAVTAHARVPGEFAALVSMHKQPEGTFFVAATFDGHADSFNVLVDTGSSFTVLNDRQLQELKKDGAAEYVEDVDGQMADGTHQTIPLYRVTAMRIGTACWIHNFEAAIFPDNTRPILGMSVLGRLAPFTVSDGPAATLKLNKCQRTPSASTL